MASLNDKLCPDHRPSETKRGRMKAAVTIGRRCRNMNREHFYLHTVGTRVPYKLS